jgi:DNA repair exonuclease SbcCD ATPase subunit
MTRVYGDRVQMRIDQLIKAINYITLVFLFLMSVLTLLSCSSGKVQELTNQNEKLQKENTELRNQIEELKRKLTELESKIAEQKSKEEEQLRNSAKEAVNALQKLEARIEVGISYLDYSRALGETLYQVEQFLQSPASSKLPEFSNSIRKVLSHYMILKEVLDLEVKSKFLPEKYFNNRIKPLYPSAKDIEYRYSEPVKGVIIREAVFQLRGAVSLLPK